jgi:Flp pilus assembly protein TadG
MNKKAINTSLGASAIEFALLFPLLFLMLYATVVYGYLYVLQNALTHTAQGAAEAAITVPTNRPDYQQAMRVRVQQYAKQSLSWLSADQRQRVLGSGGERVRVDFQTIDGVPVLRVSLRLPVEGLFPRISLPAVGSIPPLPAQLQAQATARM